MAAMAAATAPSFHSKRPSQKKRHTKPCRYYQIGACPHKAQDDCDFAHVFSEQPSVPAQQGKQCRYYLQGHCTSGIWCRYKHGDDNPEDAAKLEGYRNMNLLSGHEFGLASPLQMHVPPTATMCVPSGFSGYMAPGPWSPLEFAPPHLSPPRAVISPTASLDWSSTEYPSPSSSPTSSVSDDAVLIPADDAVTAAPHGSYFGAYPGSIRYLGVPYASDDPRYSHAPVPLRVHIPSYGMPPLYEIFSPKGPPTAGFFPGAPQSPMQKSISPQKPVSYRTKPCRFFKPGSVCPNGEACTFIHSDPKSNDSISTSLPKSSNLQHELPVKPLSKQEEETRKGYFPISWRVIGGGVMLSGNHSLSDTDESDLDFSEGSLDESDDGLTTRAPPAPTLLEIKIPSASARAEFAINFPSSTSDTASNAGTDDSVTPTGAPLRRRERAISNPTTPINTHIDVLRLFSAESPGGL